MLLSDGHLSSGEKGQRKLGEGQYGKKLETICKRRVQ